MKNRAVRALLVLLALAALAGAGFRVWQIDGLMTAAARDAATFDSQVEQLAADLRHLGAAQQAYVADGQDPRAWFQKVSDLSADVTRRLTSVRGAARSPEAQASVEAAIETMAAFGDTDARAREYLEATQRISASDVIFTDGSAQIGRAAAALDEARVREAAARSSSTDAQRWMQMYLLGGGAGVAALVLLLLLPVPRQAVEAESPAEESSSLGGLGLGHLSPSAADAGGEAGIAEIDTSTIDPLPSTPRVAPRPSDPAALPGLPEVADICGSLARVREPREIPPLLERVGSVLDAAGLIIWMPDGPKGALRPVLAHGYQPLAITRMGTIAADADNATALAYRTRAQHVVPPEAGSNAAVVSPLVTSDGCSGVVAVELKPGVEASDHLRSLAAIVAAQLATLISPAPEGGTSASRS